MTVQPERTALYRIRGEGAELLYIGISNSVPVRWNGHERVQPWWDELRSLTVEWYDSRPEAEAAEKAAILDEQPKYNITYLRPGRARKRPQSVPVEAGRAVIEPRDDDEDLLTHDDVAGMTRMTGRELTGALGRTGGPEGFILGSQKVFRRREIRQWIADVEASQEQLPEAQSSTSPEAA